MEISQNAEGDSVMYLTGVPIEGMVQQHDDNVQYVEIVCEEGSEVSFMGEGSGVGFMGETVVLEESVVPDLNLPTSESYTVTSVADEATCVVPMKSILNRNSRSLLRINNADFDVNRSRSEGANDSVSSNLVIDENCKITGGEGGELIVEIAADPSTVEDRKFSPLEEAVNSIETIDTSASVPTVYHAVVSESGEFVVPQQDLSMLCSIGFQNEAGDVISSATPRSTNQCSSSLNTPNLDTPVSHQPTAESNKSEDSPFTSFLKALPDFSMPAQGTSEQKLEVTAEPDDETSVPSVLRQIQSTEENPMSLYTLIPNIDAATTDNLCVNVSPAIADTLTQTLTENKNSDLLPVLKLKSADGSIITPQTKSKPDKPGPIFKICRVVRRPNGTVTCMQTDMRNISMGDRQAVYRTMLEKFPDIVHSKVNSVLNSQRKKKRPRQSLSKTAAPPVNPQMAVSSEEIVATEVEGDVVQEMCVDDSAIVLDECHPALTDQIPSISPDNDEVTENGNYEIDPECNPDVSDGQMEVHDEAVILSAETILNEMSESGTSPATTTQLLPIRLSEKKKTKVTAGAKRIAKPRGILTNLHQHLSSQTKQPVVKTVRIKTPSTLTAPQVTIPAPASPVILPTHACKAKTVVTCTGCNADFKSVGEFQSHAVLSYVKAVPHIYDPNAVLSCALCRGGSESFSLMSTIQEHFKEDHCVVFTTNCDECRIVSDTESKTDCDGNDDNTKVPTDLGKEEAEDIPIPDSHCSDEESKSCPKTMADVLRIVKGLEKHIFKCRYCEEEFDQRQAWRMHVRAHLGQHLMPCPLCGMAFHRKNSLAIHMRVHLKVTSKKEKDDHPDNELVRKKRLRSKQNGSELSDEDNIIPRLKEDGRPILCELCGKELKNARQLNQHQRRRHQFPCKRPIRVDLTPTPCEKCSKVCSGPTALKNHQRHFCGLKEVLCEICGKVFPFGRRALSNHKYQVHKWRGSEMEKRAKEREKARLELLGHVKKEPIDPSDETSTPSNPPKRFRQKRPRKEFKPQVCELCGFVAKYSTSLRCHLVNKHKYPKKRIRVNFNCSPTACDKCGLVCKGPAGVKLHQNRFCGREQGSLACPICGKICSSRKNLSRHKYGHKWFGTEKEKAWKEKRKMLGLPLRGTTGKKNQPMTYASHIAAEVIVENSGDEMADNSMMVEPLTEEQEDLQLVANAIMRPDESHEMSTHMTFTDENEGLLDPTNQLLQAIANDPQFAGQTIQITTETAAEEPDPNAPSGTPPKVTTYRVVRLVNHLGEPMLAYLPDVQDGM